MRAEIKDIPELLTIEEVSLRFKLSRGAIYQMISRREIPFIKMGRRIRFVNDDLILWLGRQKVEGSNENGGY